MNGKNKTPSLRISTALGCNQRCSFCQVEGDFGTNSTLATRIPVERLKASIERFVELGVRSFSLTGGEPLTQSQLTFSISRRLRKLLDEGASDGYLRINTNGVLVPRHIDDIATLFDLVKISLHSLNLERYAAITNSLNPKGDLDATLNGIAELNARKIPMRLQMVVTRDNVDEIWDFIEFCSGFEAITELKVFDISEYSELWRWQSNGAPGHLFWSENYVSLDSLEDELRCKGGILQETAYSVGGYGNPMPIYQLGSLRVRLRMSNRGAFYGEHCKSSPA